jgi:hypothetical protein
MVLLRIAWRTVAAIVTRVVADGRDTNDLLAGLTWIGIDEIAYRKGQRYLKVTWNQPACRSVGIKDSESPSRRSVASRPVVYDAQNGARRDALGGPAPD